jgi:hypothetical protein
MAHAYRLKGRGSGEVLELWYREFYNLQRLGGVAKPCMGEGTFPEVEVLPLADKIEEQLAAIEEREQALNSRRACPPWWAHGEHRRGRAARVLRLQ